jgi:hypothetical protein
MEAEGKEREGLGGVTPSPPGRFEQFFTSDILPFWKTKPQWLGAVTPATLLVVAIMALGVYVRIRDYFADRSFWLDEAMLSVNIAARDFAGLLQPLDLEQAAPPGFLFLQKLGVILLGTGERGLRLMPCIASLLALPFFYGAARRIFGLRGGIFGLFLLAVSPYALRYAVEAKQYGFDLLCVIVVLHAGAVYVTSERRFAASVWLAIAGSATLLFSHAVMFVTMTLGVGLLVREVLQRRSISRGLLLAGGFVFLAAAANYFLAIKPLIEIKGAHSHWEKYYYLPSPLESEEYFPLLGATTLEFFGKRLGMKWVWPAIGSFLLGCGLWIRRREGVWAWTVTFPLLLLVIAGTAERYPFGDRFLLFTIPLLALGVLAGFEGLIASPSRKFTIAGWVLALVIMGGSVRDSLGGRDLWRPYQKEEIRPLLEYIEERIEPDDLVLVYYNDEPTLDYYRKWVPGFEKLRDYPRVEVISFNTNIEKYRGEPSVWFVMCRIGVIGREQRLREFLQQLDSLGRRVHQRLDYEVWGYHYDLSGERATAHQLSG